MAEEKKYFTRMGDGSVIYMTEAEIRADMEDGIADAAKRGKIDPITEEEKEHLFLISSQCRAASWALNLVNRLY